MSHNSKHAYSTFRAAFIAGVVDDVYGSMDDDPQDSPLESVQCEKAAPVPEPENEPTPAESAWWALQSVPA